MPIFSLTKPRNNTKKGAVVYYVWTTRAPVQVYKFWWISKNTSFSRLQLATGVQDGGYAEGGTEHTDLGWHECWEMFAKGKSYFFSFPRPEKWKLDKFFIFFTGFRVFRVAISPCVKIRILWKFINFSQKRLKWIIHFTHFFRVFVSRPKTHPKATRHPLACFSFSVDRIKPMNYSKHLRGE